MASSSLRGMFQANPDEIVEAKEPSSFNITAGNPQHDPTAKVLHRWKKGDIISLITLEDPSLGTNEGGLNYLDVHNVWREPNWRFDTNGQGVRFGGEYRWKVSYSLYKGFMMGGGIVEVEDMPSKMRDIIIKGVIDNPTLEDNE